MNLLNFRHDLTSSDVKGKEARVRQAGPILQTFHYAWLLLFSTTLTYHMSSGLKRNQVTELSGFKADRFFL